MNNTLIKVGRPAELAAQFRAYVAEGRARNFNELLAESPQRILEFHEVSLTESFVRGHAECGLKGSRGQE